MLIRGTFQDLYPDHGIALVENMLVTMWTEIRESRVARRSQGRE